MRTRLALVGTLALALSLAATLSVGAEAKKKGKNRTFEESKVINLALPDSPGGGQPSIPLTSQITVPKKFKGKVVGDVNITGIQVTGSAAGAANDVIMALTAPSGRRLWFILGIGDQAYGPLTLDDDSPIMLCDTAATSCFTRDPEVLLRPFVGTANLAFMETGSGPLSIFNGLKMRGIWTLTVADNSSTGQTSVVNSWGLKIKAQKPVPE